MDQVGKQPPHPASRAVGDRGHDDKKGPQAQGGAQPPEIQGAAQNAQPQHSVDPLSRALATAAVTGLTFAVGYAAQTLFSGSAIGDYAHAAGEAYPIPLVLSLSAAVAGAGSKAGGASEVAAHALSAWYDAATVTAGSQLALGSALIQQSALVSGPLQALNIENPWAKALAKGALDGLTWPTLAAAVMGTAACVGAGSAALRNFINRNLECLGLGRLLRKDVTPSGPIMQHDITALFFGIAAAIVTYQVTMLTLGNEPREPFHGDSALDGQSNHLASAFAAACGAVAKNLFSMVINRKAGGIVFVDFDAKESKAAFLDVFRALTPNRILAFARSGEGLEAKVRWVMKNLMPLIGKALGVPDWVTAASTAGIQGFNITDSALVWFDVGRDLDGKSVGSNLMGAKARAEAAGLPDQARRNAEGIRRTVVERRDGPDDAVIRMIMAMYYAAAQVYHGFTIVASLNRAGDDPLTLSAERMSAIMAQDPDTALTPAVGAFAMFLLGTMAISYSLYKDRPTVEDGPHADIASRAIASEGLGAILAVAGSAVPVMDGMLPGLVLGSAAAAGAHEVVTAYMRDGKYYPPLPNQDVDQGFVLPAADTRTRLQKAKDAALEGARGIRDGVPGGIKPPREAQPAVVKPDDKSRGEAPMDNKRNVHGKDAKSDAVELVVTLEQQEKDSIDLANSFLANADDLDQPIDDNVDGSVNIFKS